MGKVIHKKFITRDDLKRNRDKIFLFGDNLQETGYSGQAKEMRGEPNSIGIPTKKSPDMNEESFFTDNEFEDNKRTIDEAFVKIPKGKTIVVPSSGLGTGLAQLNKRAPKTFQYLQSKIKEL